LRTLPKEQRRPLVPLPQTAKAVLEDVGARARRQPLAVALAEALRTTRGVDLPPSALDERALPEHLRMRIGVVDPDGALRAAGRDLRALQREHGVGERDEAATRAGAARRWRRTGLTQWDVGDLPDTVIVEQQPRDLVLYPSLADVAGRVDLRLEPPGAGAVAMHRAGVRRLLLKALPQQTALVRARTLEDRALVLAYHGVGDGAALVDDLLCASADEAFELVPPIRTAAAFAACLARGRAQLVPASDELRQLLQEILSAYRDLRRALDAAADDRRHAVVHDEILTQLEALVGPRTLTETPPEWRRQLPRYLAAAAQRWQKRGQRREPALAAQVRAAADRLEQWLSVRPDGAPWPPRIAEYRWLVEELRVSLFAEQLGTLRPVSSKRLEQAWRAALAEA
jgi:ATP-dependent helicase HrpA